MNQRPRIEINFVNQLSQHNNQNRYPNVNNIKTNCFSMYILLYKK